MKPVDQGNRWGESTCSIDACDVFLGFQDTFCNRCVKTINTDKVCGELIKMERLFFQSADEEQALTAVRSCVNGPCGFKGRVS